MSPQFLASNYRLIATARNCTQLFRTFACRLPSGRAARLLRPPPVAFSSSLLLVRPAFPAFRPSRSTRSHAANNEAPRSITAENPGASFLSSVLAPFSLSLSLLHPPSFVLPSRTHTNARGTRAHARIHSTARGLSTLLDPFRCRSVHRFLLDFTRLHRNRISTATEATSRASMLTVERRERRQCDNCRTTTTND